MFRNCLPNNVQEDSHVVLNRTDIQSINNNESILIHCKVAHVTDDDTINHVQIGVNSNDYVVILQP
jgi:hypothetical protein